MNKKHRIGSIIVACTLAATMILTPMASVYATEATQTGTVTADVLNVRSGPGTSNSRLGQIKNGAKVTVQGYSNGWYKIDFNGKTGYVAEGYLNVTTSGGSVSNKTATVNATSLNLRSGPSTSHSIIGNLKNGVKVTILSSSDGWHKVSYNGKTGYASATYLTISSSGETTPSTPDAPTTTKTGVVTADVLNVRSGAGTSYSKLGTLYSGKQVTIEGTTGGWHKISFNGKTGYVSAEFIRVKTSDTPVTPPSNDVVETNKKGVVTANYLNVRNGAGTSYKILDSISAGKEVNITAVIGDWYKISYGSKTGYVSSKYIKLVETTTPTPPSEPDTPTTPETPDSSTKPETPSETKTGTVNATSLNVRSGPGVGYSKVDLLFSGKKVTVLGTEKDWYKISYDGKTGYVSSEFITIYSGDATVPSNSKQVENLLNKARGEIGYYADEGTITKYGAWYGLPTTAWCAMFVSWCANQSGVSTSVIPRHASCWAGVDWFKNNGTWHNRAGYTPKPGDIIYFTVSHVGIVESVSDTKVTTIEGNTTNSVRRRTYSLNNSTILGYGSPAYTE